MRMKKSTKWVEMLPKILQLVNSSYLKGTIEFQSYMQSHLHVTAETFESQRQNLNCFLALGYLRPIDTVEPIRGSILINERLKDMNQSKMDKSLNESKQNSMRKEFFRSENHRRYYSPGKYVFLDAPLGRTIEKTNYAKRFLVYEILDVDFRQKIRE